MNRLGLVSASFLVVALSAKAPCLSQEPSPPSGAKPMVGKVPPGAGNGFAIDLYAGLRRAEGNLLIAPISVASGLAMTEAGARGDTARQIAKVLHLPEGHGLPHPAAATATATARGGDEAGRREEPFVVANAFWGQRGVGFLETYRKLLAEQYGARLGEVDFAADAPGASRAINAWVKESTRGKISDLIAPNALDSRTRLVLTNAVYFKGSWARPFPKAKTVDADFRVTPDRAVKVPMMSLSGDFSYLDGGDAQLLEMPYAGGALAMVILLPKKIGGLSEVESSLNADATPALLLKLRRRRIDVALPRFRIAEETSLADVLSAMGMPLAFSPRADFSGMTGTKQGLRLSSVIHKASIEVDEQGTEAAAATGMAFGVTSEAVGRPPAFRADHPFLFLIRDLRTGSILFMGRMADPRP